VPGISTRCDFDYNMIQHTRVLDRKKHQHTFGDSAGDRSSFAIVLSNILMVNIKELSEKDQRKYIKLQEYMKQLFLSCARKGRSGKVTMTQESEVPAIKVNKTRLR
jgi:hypothetical protein